MYFSSLREKKKVEFLRTMMSLDIIKCIDLSFVLLLSFFFHSPQSGEPARQRSLPPSVFFALLNISLYYSTFFGSTLPKLEDNI